MTNHTTQQVSPGHHDQAGVVFVEERKWCIKDKETATETPLKETQDLYFQSWDKPRFEGAATNIDGTPEHPWRKREGDLDGDLYNCNCDSNLTDDVQNNAENKGTHHALIEFGNTLSNQPQHPHPL